MRSFFSGFIIVMLSASIAVEPTALAQQHPQRSPGYGRLQARGSHRQATKNDLQPSLDDLKAIEKNNRDLDLPTSQNDVMGAVQVHSEEEAQMKRIEQDSVRIDRETRNICPSC